MALGPGIVLGLSPDILLRALAAQDLYYAFNIVTGDHFSLNQTSYWILENISDHVDWDELIAKFLDTFDVPPEQGRADLESIICQFLNEQIVRRVTDGQAEETL